MLKRFVSIMMIFCALALMLGHDFIPHHHDLGHNATTHHHHHHDGHHHDHDSDDESEDWRNLFSGIQHGADGLTFLTSHNFANNFAKEFPQSVALQTSSLTCIQVIIEVRQNVPPYISDYYNSHSFLPSGLRAPPITIV